MGIRVLFALAMQQKDFGGQDERLGKIKKHLSKGLQMLLIYNKQKGLYG